MALVPQFSPTDGSLGGYVPAAVGSAGSHGGMEIGSYPHFYNGSYPMPGMPMYPQHAMPPSFPPLVNHHQPMPPPSEPTGHFHGQQAVMMLPLYDGQATPYGSIGGSYSSSLTSNGFPNMDAYSAYRPQYLREYVPTGEYVPERHAGQFAELSTFDSPPVRNAGGMMRAYGHVGGAHRQSANHSAEKRAFLARVTSQDAQESPLVVGARHSLWNEGQVAPEARGQRSSGKEETESSAAPIGGSVGGQNVLAGGGGVARSGGRQPHKRGLISGMLRSSSPSSSGPSGGESVPGRRPKAERYAPSADASSEAYGLAALQSKGTGMAPMRTFSARRRRSGSNDSEVDGVSLRSRRSANSLNGVLEEEDGTSEDSFLDRSQVPLAQPSGVVPDERRLSRRHTFSNGVSGRQPSLGPSTGSRERSVPDRTNSADEQTQYRSQSERLRHSPYQDGIERNKSFGPAFLNADSSSAVLMDGRSCLTLSPLGGTETFSTEEFSGETHFSRKSRGSRSSVGDDRLSSLSLVEERWASSGRGSKSPSVASGLNRTARNLAAPYPSRNPTKVSSLYIAK